MAGREVVVDGRASKARFRWGWRVASARQRRLEPRIGAVLPALTAHVSVNAGRRRESGLLPALTAHVAVNAGRRGGSRRLPAFTRASTLHALPFQAAVLR